MIGPGSPWQQFGTGNYETLHDMPMAAGEVSPHFPRMQPHRHHRRSLPPQVIRDHLIRFHQTHYVAPNMRLAVLTSAPIDIVSSWVAKHFSDVPVSYPGVTPPPSHISCPSDAIAENFDKDWFRMSAPHRPAALSAQQHTPTVPAFAAHHPLARPCHLAPQVPHCPRSPKPRPRGILGPAVN
jgi:hypothetical protein